MKRLTKTSYRISLLVAALALSACSNDDNDEVVEVTPPQPVTYTYQIKVTNLTPGQPASPVAVALHPADMPLWTIGQPASEGLALLAESGDNSEFLANTALLATASAEQPTLPGDSVEVSVSIEDNADTRLSVAAMLGNTNDAFTGFTAMDLSQLSVGDVITRLSVAYDAGTEDNTESAMSVPGPAGGGQGTSEGREIHDFVSMHPGIVTAEGGLSSSVLTSDHRFDNPVLRISVMRME
jgi:hypothetical protein